jgi:hypothetical protein
MATAVLTIGVSVVSTGGLAAIAIRKFGVKNAVDNHSASSTRVKEDHHG